MPHQRRDSDVRCAYVAAAEVGGPNEGDAEPANPNEETKAESKELAAAAEAAATATEVVVVVGMVLLLLLLLLLSAIAVPPSCPLAVKPIISG